MIPTARLIIGTESASRARVIEILQRECCLSNGCRICESCVKIAEQRDWRIIWTDASTKDALDLVLDRCAYHSGGVTYYFVLCAVDQLSAAAAARLLKDLEEPPTGYYFLLTAKSRDSVIPTIISRSHTEYCDQDELAVNRWAGKIGDVPFSQIAREISISGDVRSEVDTIVRALCAAYNVANDAERIRLGHAICMVQKLAMIPVLPGTDLLIIRAIVAAILL